MKKILTLFYILSCVVKLYSQNNINYYEYWFDDNYSIKTELSFPPIPQLVLDENISTDGISIGLHTFHIRFKDDSARFSSIVSQFFYKSEADVTGGNIQAYEYWFDDNYADKINSTISPVAAFQINEAIENTLTNGLHTFHIRFKDSGGLWSAVVSQFFYKSDTESISGNIATYEYWFDDDYTGKVSESTMPASTFQVNEAIENTLTNGLHTFHIRFKDSGALWSSVVSQFFYKSNAGVSTGTIAAYAYWFDDNYADKVFEETPATETFQINETISADLTNGLHTLHIRFKDSEGLWSSIVSQFFYKSSEITGVENLITAYSYWFNDLDSLITTVELPVPLNPYFLVTEVNATALDTGYHQIHFRFRDTKSLWSSIVTDTFYNVGKPELTSITPAVGGNTGDVTVNIYGNGFFDNTIVSLILPGIDTIVVPDSLMAIFDAKRIQATFDLREKALGFYNVVVEVQEVDTVMKLISGFEIIEGIPAQPYVNVIGFNTIRANQWQTYTLVCGNSGNVNAMAVPLLLAIPQSVEFELEFETYKPTVDSIVDWDTLNTYIVGDSMMGEPFECILIPLIIPNIPPNSEILFNVKLLSPITQSFQLQAAVSLPIYQSPPNPQTIQCLVSLYEASSPLFEAIPYFDCFYSTAKLLIDPVIELALGDPSYTELAIDFVANGILTIYQCSGVDDVIDTYGAVAQALYIGANYWDTYSDCAATLGNFLGEILFPINTVTSYDPNDKTGPLGFGISYSIADNQPFTYLVRFENDSAATAYAQTVKIIDTLDAALFDYNTFEFGFISFSDTIINIPPNQQHFDTYVDLRPELNIVVQLNADFNDTTGAATWKYTALDPNTYLPVTDPLSGFLPPNIISPEGQGSVFYTVHVKGSLDNGVEIKNKAYIYFDYNEPIVTNEWSNTLDNVDPVSEVNDLSEYTTTDLFTITWSGTDEGSQIENYDIYYSVNGGAYKPWLLNTSETSSDFYGFYDSTYAFYSIAKDTAGNLEMKPLAADAITTLINCGSSSVSLNIENDTSICAGETITISTTGTGDAFLWSTGETDPEITVSEEGDYFVNVSYSGVCNVNSDTIHITISPLPVTPEITADGSTDFCIGDSVTLTSDISSDIEWSTGDTTESIVVDETGIYTVTALNICGNAISDGISVTAHLYPEAIITPAGALEFCDGDSVILYANEGDFTYLWSTGSTADSTVIDITNAVFVIVTDAYGCTTISDEIAITSYPNPAIPLITNSNDTLFTIAGYSYEWYFEGILIPGASDYYYVATENGNYSVEITDTNGCFAESENFGYTNVDIANINTVDKLLILPNPNNGNYSLLFNSTCSNTIDIFIYNAVGELIITDKGDLINNSFSKNYNLSSMAKGNYIVKVVCDGNTYFKKLVIQ